MADFYGHRLGGGLVSPGADRFSLAIGETAIEFVAGSGEPFYHFALLVPGNRFGEALAWARVRTELLPNPGSGGVVFDFASWDAYACYFLDPAGNIVELIAHRGVEETGAEGEFRSAELVGLSELGLVGEPAAMAAGLAGGLGLELWDGSVDKPGRLAFVGEQARTLILSPPGRGWLPTRRPAEPDPVEALIASATEGEANLEGTRYRIRSTTAV